MNTKRATPSKANYLDMEYTDTNLGVVQCSDGQTEPLALPHAGSRFACHPRPPP